MLALWGPSGPGDVPPARPSCGLPHLRAQYLTGSGSLWTSQATDLPALVGNTLQRAQRFTHREINVPLRDSPRDERGRQWESRGQGGGRRAEDPEQRARHCPRMCPAWICPGADQPAPALTEEPSLLPFADQGLSCVTADLWAWPPDDERDEESHTEREREPPEPQAKPRGKGSGGGDAPRWCSPPARLPEPRSSNTVHEERLGIGHMQLRVHPQTPIQRDLASGTCVFYTNSWEILKLMVPGPHLRSRGVVQSPQRQRVRSCRTPGPSARPLLV